MDPVRLWNLGTSAQVGADDDHRDFITSLSFARNGSVLSSDAAGKTSLWNNLTGGVLKEFNDGTDGVLHSSFDRNENLVITAGADKIAKS